VTQPVTHDEISARFPPEQFYLSSNISQLFLTSDSDLSIEEQIELEAPLEPSEAGRIDVFDRTTGRQVASFVRAQADSVSNESLWEQVQIT
ncbi:hypothetical protein KKE06_02550, partial [Candidatus Micrarchaeota archaeon]|nr:hypothetical protein [Candidatus Micrarchaeota archaeon]